jgi:CHAD domain-containing protein
MSRTGSVYRSDKMHTMLLSVKAATSLNDAGIPARPSAAGDDGGLLGALDCLVHSYSVAVGAPHRSDVVHVDTADWRVLRAGLSASYRPRGGLFVVATEDGSRAEQLSPGLRWPVLIGALPPGEARDRIEGPLGVRALMPVARTRTTLRAVTVRNHDDKIVARLSWRQIHVLEPVLPVELADLAPRIEIRPLRGYDRDGDRIRHLLTAAGVLDASRQGEFAEIAARTGLGPAAAPAPIRPRDHSDAAVARVLLTALDDIQATAPGVLADIDTEFLHDLRVDVRRTRSLLKRLGDVLPGDAVARFAPEFKWLGAVTTPTRDLDVYLLGMDEMAALVPHPDDLGPFIEHLEARRNSERRTLVRALRSDRFTRLCEDWRVLLSDIIAAGGSSRITAARLADERLVGVYGKVAKKAKAIDAYTPAEDVHDLRKAAKDLRYLLEAFQPLADPDRYRLVLKDLKRLQDVLGEFQDGEVQATSLRTYAQEMIDLGETRAQAILAMGELAGRFGAQQIRARGELDAHHAEYLGSDTEHRLRRLVRG